MLNDSLSYPYPVLKGKTDCYKTSIFSSSIQKEILEDGYKIIVNYDTNNSAFQGLLDEKIIAYALQIQCLSTWYRKMEISEGNTQEIIIPAHDIHNRVDLCPCIVALKDIEKLPDDDFTEDYEGIDYSVTTGSVIGIGERYKFDAIFEDDIIKKSESIITFVEDARCSVMHCEWESETIKIALPSKQNAKYQNMGNNEKYKIPLLNAIYVVPAIIQAITEIAQDELHGGEGNMASYAWYKTLKFLIQRMAGEESGSKYRQYLSDPIGTAQILMGDNSSEALSLLGDLTKQ